MTPVRVRVLRRRLRVIRDATLGYRERIREARACLTARETAQIAEAFEFLDASLIGIDRTLRAAERRQFTPQPKEVA